MSNIIHRPTDDFIKKTNLYTFLSDYDFKSYREAHERSVSDSSWFWRQVIHETDIEFFETFNAVTDDSTPLEFREWFINGKYNLAHDAVDKHVASGQGEDVAIVWENESKSVIKVTYKQLQRQANRVANTLKKEGVQQGDRVLVYVPNVPRTVSILYGAFKIGAVPVPLFSGYGTDSIVKRIESAQPTIAFVGDGYKYSGNTISQKETFDEALRRTDNIEHVILIDNLSDNLDTTAPEYSLWLDTVASASSSFETKSLQATSTAMIIYTSGTTGKPKGTVHTHIGLGTKFAKDLFFDFDFKPSERLFWITDLGWIMGPWSIVGAHILGGSVALYSGAIDTPSKNHLWEIIERHDITTLGLSPTAIRALRTETLVPTECYDLRSLRILGSTGEPWDKPNWRWFYENVGGGRAPIINVSGGTEAGGHFLAPTPIQPLKPCTVGGPTLGVDADIVDEQGKSVREQNQEGYLVLRNAIPSLTNGFWNDDDRYLETYWSSWDSLWDHGDWAQMDSDGFWYLHGRADDIINIAGRKVAPAEIEEVLNRHIAVREAAAIGREDERTTNHVAAYIVRDDAADISSQNLKLNLLQQVGNELGKPFRPRYIEIVESLPKTHSGKISRQEI